MNASDLILSEARVTSAHSTRNQKPYPPIVNMSEREKKQTKAENIRVVCRFRPANEIEIEKGSLCVSFQKDLKAILMSTPQSAGPVPFEFDRVFDCNASQGEVYEEIGLPIVQGLLIMKY